MKKNNKIKVADANELVANIAYKLSEVVGLYPITPSTPLAETVDRLQQAKLKNIFDQIIQIIEMQSEEGAASVVHGALLNGCLSSTFTSSQGLLLMIPVMYKLSGECLPAVFHIAARAIATHALSIFGDHQDVMGTRATGFCILNSNNPQEAQDLALIAHLSAIKSSLPFIHFFDGFRTSHEINKVSLIDDSDIKKLFPKKEYQKFKSRSISCFNPKQTGTSQNPDIYFQNREAANKLYDKVYDNVSTIMKQFNQLKGTNYQPFNYYGDKNAQTIIVSMGSSCDTIQTTIDFLKKKTTKKIGLVKVRLFNPFNEKEFSKLIPNSAKQIIVLDRTKEPGAIAEPLFLNVVKSLYERKLNILGGRYGLGGKDFTPNDVIAIFENAWSKKPKTKFTVGINDDVTFLSLPKNKIQYVEQNKIYECKFYGLGSDGTVSANKNSIKIIGECTDKYVQGFFVYDSKKSNGITVSHLRFSDKVISHPFLINSANFIGIHNYSYVHKYDILEDLKDNGIVLLNTSLSEEQLSRDLSENFKTKLKNKKAKLFIINANKLAVKIGLKNKINLIMQTAFFKLLNIFDFDFIKQKLIDFATKTYASKGEKLIEANKKAILEAQEHIKEIDINNLFKNKSKPFTNSLKVSEYYKKFCQPILSLKGDDLPVSSFSSSGAVPTNTTKYEKRSIASYIPKWISENCIQCGQCSLICPQSAIRTYLIDDSEIKNLAPNTKVIKAIGFQNKSYVIQVSPDDCTGCLLCISSCIAKNKALMPIAYEGQNKIEELNKYQTISTHADKNINTIFKKETVKGIQFYPNYFEFSGACSGCGETPYIRLLTKLFGNKMLIANATGCSSIYGGSAPTCPYIIDQNNLGPSWSNSLFENNAEFGIGILLANEQKKQQSFAKLETIINEIKNQEIKQCFEGIKTQDNNTDNTSKIINFIELLKKHKIQNTIINQIENMKDDLINKTIWIVGGDGWAYDIGFGGLDHVLSLNKKINILVLNNQLYSNTGGQTSKATPIGSVAKFSLDGKNNQAKDLAAIAMTYKNVYVAQICIGANPQQAINAFVEANNYPGTSLIIAYCPCIEQGLNMSQAHVQMKKAVASGYWKLFRYNPLNEKPMTIDSNFSDKQLLKEYELNENRFAQLYKKNVDKANNYLDQLQSKIDFDKEKYEKN